MENQEKNETTVLPENPEIMVKNPRIGKVRKLEEEARTSWSSSEPNGSARSRNISSR